MVDGHAVHGASEAGAKNLQGDLFTSEERTKSPKRGDRSHIHLRSLDGEKAVVPGMASFAGGGPAGAPCRDCIHFGVVAVQTGIDDVEINRAGCAIYANHMGHAGPTTHRDIRVCPACKHFVASAEREWHFIIERAGKIHGVDKLPPELPKWRPTGSSAPEGPAKANRPRR